MRKHPGETFYLVPTILLTNMTLYTLDQAHKGLLSVLPPIGIPPKYCYLLSTCNYLHIAANYYHSCTTPRQGNMHRGGITAPSNGFI